MVKIRLRRTGAKKAPAYRIVVADSRSPRDGRFIETIGLYNPLTEPTTLQVKADRAVYWLNNGAQASDTCVRLLMKAGIEHSTLNTQMVGIQRQINAQQGSAAAAAADEAAAKA